MSDNVKIEEINKLIKEYDCQCINIYGFGKYTQLVLKCVLDHQWKYYLSHFMKGYYECPECKRNKLRKNKLKEIHEYAKSKGGECLSTEYIGHNKKLKFKCKREHIWEARYDMECWCRLCSIEDKRIYSIDKANEYAKLKMGKCISTVYKSTTDKLKWQCYNGHIWEAIFKNIKDHDSWCPYCNINLGEEITRNIFEILFNNKFIRLRPIWLNKLEFDGYCEELKLAFEYDGIQHYKFIEYFHKSEEDFKKQQEHDTLKNKLCEQNNIKLIRIPYIIKYDKIKDHIYEECNKKAIIIPNNINIDYTKFTNIYTKKFKRIVTAEDRLLQYNNERYNELKRMVEAKEGTLISTQYINATDKIKVKCHCGYIWDTSFHTLQGKCRNLGCPKCSKRLKLTIDDLQETASKKEGKCLSTIFMKIKDKYLWECKKKHQWYATARNVRYKNTWCPQCYNEQKSNSCNNTNK